MKIFDSPLHILILVLIVVLLFGAKKLPDLSRSVARSMRIFKSEVREMKEEDRQASPGASSSPGTPANPLEGRVVDADGHRTPATGSTAASAAPTAEQQRHSA